MALQGHEGKKYGLIIKKRDQTAAAVGTSRLVATGSVFGKPVSRPPASATFTHHSSDSELEHSDSEKGAAGEDGSAQAIGPSKKMAAGDYLRKKVTAETQKDIDKALAEDPTCFQYDEVYDDISHTSTMQRAAAVNKTVEKKPKYIENLLVAADQRKREYERRVERQIQKEREAEGEQFADKEAFVTTAYREKLKQMKEDEERERAKEAAEAKMDVTKQGDLSMFYRNILEQTTRSGVKKEETVPQQPSVSDASDKAKQTDSVIINNEQKPGVESNKNAADKSAASSSNSRRSRSRSRSRDRRHNNHHRRSRSRSTSKSRRKRSLDSPQRDRRGGGNSSRHKRSPSPQRSRSPVKAKSPPVAHHRPGDVRREEKADSKSHDKQQQQAPATIFDKRNAGETVVLSAKERYLQRKTQRTVPTSDD